MAFFRTKFNTFYQFLKNTKQGLHPEERAVAENFILEERLSESREDSYEENLKSPSNIEDWLNCHEEYLENKINVCSDTPETFTLLNKQNLLPKIDEDQFIVRLENISRPCSIWGIDTNKMIDYLNNYVEYKDIVDKFLVEWNDGRDFRPIFAGFWGEVKDIFSESDENEIQNEDWPNQLRDRFGLGHLDPKNGEPIPVLLLRYRVSDVLKADSGNIETIAVPTVLDSGWGPFFCPTPQDGWNEGQTLDLSHGNEDDYSLTCEIIHKFIGYEDSYLYRAGLITKPPGKTCEEARKIHLEFLRNDFKHFGKIKEIIVEQ